MNPVLSIVRSELTKTLTLPSVWLVTGILVALHVVVQSIGYGTSTEMVANMTPEGLADPTDVVDGLRPVDQALTGYLLAGSFQLAFFLPVLGAVIAGAEFRAGQLGLSVLAVPSRIRLVSGKIIAIALYALVLGLVFVAIASAFMYAVVRDWDTSILWSADALVGQARVLLFTVAFLVISLAITLIIRNILPSIIAMTALSVLTVSSIFTYISPALDALFPLSAGRNLFSDPEFLELTAGRDHATVVLLVWTVATVAVAAFFLQKKDAR